jgi:2,3-dihydroxybiphenyl 1,2-dioxygenase
MPVERLGYVGFEAPNVADWSAFFTGVAGFMPGEDRADGSRTFRLDEYAQRFIVQEGAGDDIAFVGWEVKDAPALDAMRRKLTDAGVTITDGDRTLAEYRRVEALFSFSDPNGIRGEIFWGPAIAETPFHSPQVPDGFVTGECGLGHVVFPVKDWQQTFDFYTGVMGLRLSDYIKASPVPGIRVHVTFLHANSRHHSYAFFVPPFPFPKKLQHVMVETKDMSAVGRAFDRALEGGTPIAMSLGHHPNDGSFSFYARTPCGVELEIGWGSMQVDDCIWQPRTYSQLSDWGHRRGG